jgi:hypothetical protein
MTSKLANYLALTEACDLVCTESELAEDLVGMLPKVRRMPPQFGLGS